MTDRIAALRLFARVARLGCFSSAGHELGLSQPSASRLIAALERSLGVALVNRTTRALTLTDAGVVYLKKVEEILTALDEAAHCARGTGELRGTLRVGVCSSFLLREIIPVIPGFLKQHPALHVEFLISDRHQNLTTEAIDVAFRFGPLPDSAAIARKISKTSRILAASPSYLDEFGAPVAPSDLVHHRVILGPMHLSPFFSFRRAGRLITVRAASHVTITLDDGAVAAAANGLGIVSSSLISCRSELRNKTLVRLLTDWTMDGLEIHAMYGNAKVVRSAARALTNFLVDRLRGEDLSLRESTQTFSTGHLTTPRPTHLAAK
jgi:DNA-binding transcriptional LysR family regulator